VHVHGARLSDPMLSFIVFLPLAGALLVLLAGGRGDDHDRGPLVRRLALATSLLTFAATLVLWWRFDPSVAAYQFEERHAWIPVFGIQYYLGVDGISLLLIVLTGFLTPLAQLSSWDSVHKNVKAFAFFLLALESAMLGVFASIDLFLFYIFWDAMLIPMYFLIGIWGYERRIYAAVKFILYTMAGSVLMLVAIIGLAWAHAEATGSPSFNLLDLYNVQLPQQTQNWFFFAFALAFLIKVPLFPFHTWLPDAHVEAPTAGSVILAGIMLKMGTFGFLRFALPLFPGTAMNPTVRMVILVLAVIGIIYGALVAMVQPDFKKLVAYSSVSHLGFVMLGIFALTLQSVQGALMVMINHGISTGALFLLVGMIYERRHSRLIESYGGIARVVPLFAAILTFVSLSSIGLPGTNGFVGEFLVLVGSFKTYPVLTIIATTGVIFAAAYLLWAIQRILFNPLDKKENNHLPDLNRRELALLVPLIAVIIWLGVYPAPVLRRMEGSAQLLVDRVHARESGTAQQVSEAGR
jgi:NADH-quinone oxidoreductase subunit M